MTRRGEIYTVRDLAWDGRGVARDKTGRTLFLEGALPGDRVRGELTHSGKRASFGRVSEMVVPSPVRVPHPCPHYKQGCPASPLGALQYKAALDWKRRHLEETLRRVGGLGELRIGDVIPSPAQWEYRDRLELHLERTTEGATLGYKSRRGIIPVDDCPLGTPPLRAALKRLAKALPTAALDTGTAAARILLRDNGRDGAVGVLFVKGKSDGNGLWGLKVWLEKGGLAGWQIRGCDSFAARLMRSRPIAESGNPDIYREIAGYELVCNPVVFIQVNLKLAKRLVDVVLEHLPAKRSLLDIYGGFGAFSFDYAARGGRGMVIEAAGTALRAGRSFASQTGLGVDFTAGDLADRRLLRKLRGEYDAVVADPPRSGLHPPVVQWLNSRGPARVVYVSCHPAALARDLKRLTSYRPALLQPVDLFPGTPDLETVAVLDRGGE